MNEKELSKKIGNLITNKRHANDMTQSDVGKLLKIAFQQVQKYEKGKNRIPFPKLVYLLKSLNIKFAELDLIFADVQLPSEQTIQQERVDNVECS